MKLKKFAIRLLKFNLENKVRQKYRNGNNNELDIPVNFDDIVKEIQSVFKDVVDISDEDINNQVENARELEQQQQQQILSLKKNILQLIHKKNEIPNFTDMIQTKKEDQSVQESHYKTALNLALTELKTLIPDHSSNVNLERSESLEPRGQKEETETDAEPSQPVSNNRKGYFQFYKKEIRRDIDFKYEVVEANFINLDAEQEYHHEFIQLRNIEKKFLTQNTFTVDDAKLNCQVLEDCKSEYSHYKSKSSVSSDVNEDTKIHNLLTAKRNAVVEKQKYNDTLQNLKNDKNTVNDVSKEFWCLH